MRETFVTDQEIMRDEFQVLLEELGFQRSEPLYNDMTCLLSAPGKLLSPSPSSMRLPKGYWALLPYTIAHYCVPTANVRFLSRIGIACEILLTSLDAFDEIEDDDVSEQRTALGDGRFLNTATLLYTLVPLVLDSLCPHFLSVEHLRELQHLLTMDMVKAIRGQHRDILAEQDDLTTFLPEECLHIVSAKSGVLFELVCRMGALAVGAQEELVNSFAEIGEFMGIVAQLENDVHGLEHELDTSEENVTKSDLRRGKKTLPIVLARKQFAGLQSLEADTSVDEKRMYLTAFDQAIKATLGAATHLREEALMRIPYIEQLRGETVPMKLRVLLNLVSTY
jgi:geranylgeranyl pyrophosphate synthase